MTSGRQYLQASAPRWLRRAAFRLALGAAPLVAACPVQLPRPAIIAFACEDDSDCRDGTFCQDNLCLSIDGSVIRRDAGHSDRAGNDRVGLDRAGTDAALPDGTDIDQPGGDGASADAGAWWDGAWQRRRKLTFNNSGRAEALVDFPVLVKLDSTRVDYATAGFDGKSVRFVDADGTSVLDYQLDKWNANSTSWLWVRVPQIDADGANDHIWLYYDNGSADIQGQGIRVWSAGYQAVFPLSVNFLDMSGYGFAGTDHFSDPTPGVISFGRSFDGSAWLDLGTGLALLMSAPAATLSAWIKPGNNNADQTVIAIARNGTSPTSEARAFLALRNFEIVVGGRSLDIDSQQELVSSGHPLSVDQWHHVVGMINYVDRNARIFVDGEQTALGSLAVTATATSPTESACAAIGADADGQSHRFNGVIDDVRVSRRTHTADWIRAEFQNQGLDSFVQFGPEEQSP